MSDAHKLIEELSKAIQDGDVVRIKEIKRKILMGDRDTSIDENFMSSISGKTLYRNVKKVINEDSSLSKYDYAKIMSSLITHSIIESEISGKTYSDYGINDMYLVLGKLISEEEGAIGEARSFILSRYGEFISG